MKIHRVVLTACSEDERDKILERSQRLLNEHYDDFSAQYLRDSYCNAAGAVCDVGILTDKNGSDRGVQIIASVPVSIPGGRRFAVIRSVVCKSSSLPRGTRSFETFGPVVLMRHVARAWRHGQEPWLVASSDTPASFYRMSAYFRRMVPAPRLGQEPSTDDLATYQTLARSAGFRLDPSFPFCSRDEPRFRISREQRESWMSRAEPAIRSYIAHCPDFGDGIGLVFCVPLTPLNLATLPTKMLAQTCLGHLRMSGASILSPAHRR